MIRYLVAAIIATIPSLVLAWGPLGHKAVGEIAAKHLTPETAKKVKDILGDLSLSDSAVWADTIRGNPQQYAYTFPWHFMEIPANENRQDVEHADNHDNVYGAIDRFLLNLSDPVAVHDTDQLDSLKFLVHFVGDIHQPLHVGNGLDRGGNECTILWNGKRLNLHRIWDTEILEAETSDLERLVAIVDKDASIPKTMDVADWAMESRAITDTIYPGVSSKPFVLPAYCRANQGQSNIPKLGDAYAKQFKGIAQERLRLAGRRLAQLLNEHLK